MAFLLRSGRLRWSGVVDACPRLLIRALTDRICHRLGIIAQDEAAVSVRYIAPPTLGYLCSRRARDWAYYDDHGYPGRAAEGTQALLSVAAGSVVVVGGIVVVGAGAVVGGVSAAG